MLALFIQVNTCCTCKTQNDKAHYLILMHQNELWVFVLIEINVLLRRINCVAGSKSDNTVWLKCGKKNGDMCT